MKPNILFILTDQQRRDTLQAYQQDTLCQTPNLDELAQHATVFDDCYTTCPICTPARASLQTGLYPMHHGMLTNSYNYGNMVQELPDSPALLSRRLAAAGYQIGYTGKWHLGTGVANVQADPYVQYYMGTVQFAEYQTGYDAVPTHVGYTGDDFPGHGFGGFIYPEYKEWLAQQGKTVTIEHRISGYYEGHQAGQITSGVDTSVDQYLIERTKHYLSGFAQNNKPWFFQLNFWGPHEPYFVPSEFLHLYDNVKLPPWPNFQDPPTSQKPKIHDLKRGNIRDWAELEPIVKHYYAEITHIDYQIGRLIDWLKDTGQYDNTLIIFSADHGESLGIHGGLFDKAIFMYDETTTVPLFWHLPGQVEPGRVSPFVNSVDLYSTILDYAGVPAKDQNRDGQSFRPLIEGQDVAWPDKVVSECSGIGSVMFSQRMLRQGDYKYVFNCGDIDELYDLSSDPHEMINQIDNPGYQTALHAMRLSLRDWMIEHHDNLIYEFNHLRLPLNERDTGKQF